MPSRPMLLTKILQYTLIVFACNVVTPVIVQRALTTQVLVVSGEAGGTTAGLQAARLEVSSIIAEATTWVGGILSTTGVAAIDGNHQLPSSLWREFREKIYNVYGGAEKGASGWVSNTQFESQVADSIFKAMAGGKKKLKVLYQSDFVKVIKKGEAATWAIFKNYKNEKLIVNTTIVFDATEMGDVMANANVRFDLGMEGAEILGENVGDTSTNNIVQNLTYVAVLKDFGPKADCTIVKPIVYNPMEFDSADTDYYNNKSYHLPGVNARKILDYGRLSDNKGMLNWPNKSNDTYINMVGLSGEKRQAAIDLFNQKTLCFIYFIQLQREFEQLGLATEQFGTPDHLALTPYHREGRRLQGLTRITINESANLIADLPLYRTGIAVSDYSIDHHHKKNPLATQYLNFFPVPFYSVPMGALVPEKINGSVVAEKGISVGNVANGTTPLKPYVLFTGQATGMQSAFAVLNHQQPRQVNVRKVQQQLLNAEAYFMPFIDVMYNHPHFSFIQKIGATGILSGSGSSYIWANQTWFYPDSLVYENQLRIGLKDFTKQFTSSNVYVTVNDANKLIADLATAYLNQTKSNKFPFTVLKSLRKNTKYWIRCGLENFEGDRQIARSELAVLLDKTVDPFTLAKTDDNGNIKQKIFK